VAEQFTSNGLSIAPGVLESILAQEVLQIDGVASVGASKAIDGVAGSGRRRKLGQGITLLAEDDQIVVTVHLRVYFGYRLQDVAAAVRSVISEALGGQIGVKVAAIDICIDGIAAQTAQP